MSAAGGGCSIWKEALVDFLNPGLYPPLFLLHDAKNRSLKNEMNDNQTSDEQGVAKIQ